MLYFLILIFVFHVKKKKKKSLTATSARAHPKRHDSGHIQTGILVLINNQSFSCATLKGRGIGL